MKARMTVWGAVVWGAVVVLALSMFSLSAHAASFVVNVVDGDGNPVNGFRWVLEEDNTHPVTPGVLIERSGVPAGNATMPSNSASVETSLAFDFHASHAPVATATIDGRGLQGETPGSSQIVENVRGNLNNPRRYYISVLPYEGYTMGGAQVLIDERGSNEPVTVIVQEHPLKTAQISVFVFEDNQPLNNAPDLPEEGGLGGTEWTVVLYESGGLYGVSGGQVLQDAFGNPLGTTYAPGDPDTIITMGDGVIHPDPATGVVVVENLVPAKYGIQIVPPPGQGWIQTSTLEGSKTVDAWVKANEPSFFMEFGPPGHHVFIGFVQRELNDTDVLTGGATITGQITNLHTSRPPDFSFYSGEPFPGCFIGLNDLAVGEGNAVFVQECDGESGFQIDNVPEGNYQLVVFDKNLDIIIGLLGLTVDAGAVACNVGQSCDLGEVPVFNWFGKVDAWGFFDVNENGYWDDGEIGMPPDSTALSLRFRNGQVYQAFGVDTIGNAPFDEVFPFFHWLVYEWDFGTLKATGATFTNDDGGPLAIGEITNPQPQVGLSACTPTLPGETPVEEECTFDGLSSTVVGPALTQGFQVMAGQANVIEWGKGLYGTNENGGISGLVINTVTRAEDDPAWAANEEWEALIPRAQVNLYQDNLTEAGELVFGGDGIVDDVNGILGVQYADVDNHPLGWGDPGCVDNPDTVLDECARGNEDTDHDSDGVFDFGDAIDVGWSDSWDDNKPSGCQGDNGVGFENLDCFDGLRNYNQSRPALFDGGYAFGPRYDCTPDGGSGCTEGDFLALGDDGFGYLKSGQYIVQGIAPPGYEHIKEEDRNVDFGDIVVPQLPPPACVGDLRVVPPWMSMSTDSGGNVVVSSPEPAPFAGDERPLCDRKTIALGQGQNGALDFHMMTETPKAARVVGVILDDTSNEFDPNSPNFGEKWAPPWIPVSFRDSAGVEIGKTYGDEFGHYNALLPSTFTANAPIPSGMGPNMLTACMNSAALVPNPKHPAKFIPDPFHNNQYSQFCYTFQYMPGSTTYLDTPVIPIGAFAGGGQFPVDCEYDAGTPRIASVNRGQWGPFARAGTNQTLVVRSVGKVEVPNPAYDGIYGSEPKTIVRDYRFGNADGTVELIDENGSSTVLNPAPGNWWNQRRARVRIPGSVSPGAYQLVLTKANGNVTPTGVTVTVANSTGPNNRNPVNDNPPIRVPIDHATIQGAIDAAVPGDLILVAPGTYEELVILYKPVALQGWGPGKVTINGIKSPAEKLQGWRDKMADLLGATTGNVFPDGLNGTHFDLLPGQEQGFSPQDNEPEAFRTGEGPVILVMAHRDRVGVTPFAAEWSPRIDGFTLTGADDGGGVFVNGYADSLQISNNRVVSNAGWHGGGIRIGHSTLLNEVGDGDLVVSDGQNDNIKIHHNQIAQNGSIGETGGAGGGVAIFTGADNYEVTDNLICGNFATTDGAGVGHRGLSRDGLIARNSIIFNQSFNQGSTVSGAGISIAGSPPPNIEFEPLTAGSGSVEINGNLIQGNQAGAGDGGGIRTAFVNGQDVVDSPLDETAWYSIDVFNNMIVNNVAGLAGGGMSLQDTASIRITNNTIANNDSTATAGEAFSPGSPNQSNPQPAGLVSRAHSGALSAALAAASGVPDWATRLYSQPHLFDNNILWHNRSFIFLTDASTTPDTFGLCPDLGGSGLSCPGGSTPVYDDLAVLGTAPAGLAPMYSVFSEDYSGPGFGDSTNTLVLDAEFVAGYVNGGRGETITIPEIGSAIVAQPAFDEGGNFIDVHFGPLSLNVDAPLVVPPAPSDYHLDSLSPAIGIADTKTDTPLLSDIDEDVRSIAWDSGADETTP
ncbi:MAG: hypothetical protein CL908_18575 [Deltaproteobacteria bacterium]|nr:hypothetical protein [Deltaproteobacteria bacterium]